MASGIARNVSGSYVGTGVAPLVIAEDKVGFKPRRLTIERTETALVKVEHLEGMADGSYFKTAADGTRTLETTGGPTLLPTGFSLGGADDVNAADGVFRFFAEQ